jgi:hypothetical protein
MRRIALALLPTVVLAAAPARAFEGFDGTRPLGMANTGRAYAIGDAGPLLNPSGMSLERLYHVEGDYGFSSVRNDNFLHASIVDSTSALLVAGGLYYTFHRNYPDGFPAGSGHEAGLALSMPLGERLAFGGTLKYFLLSGDQERNGHKGGLTFDLGITARPMPMLTLGVVGTNLRDLGTSEAQQGIGYGVAFRPAPGALLAADGMTPFTSDTYTGRKVSSFGLGASYLLAGRYGASLGGGYDGTLGNVFLSAGFSLVSSDIGAIDISARQDITRHETAGVAGPRATVLGVGVRLFVPDNQSPLPAENQLSGP